MDSPAVHSLEAIEPTDHSVPNKSDPIKVKNDHDKVEVLTMSST